METKTEGKTHQRGESKVQVVANLLEENDNFSSLKNDALKYECD